MKLENIFSAKTIAGPGSNRHRVLVGHLSVRENFKEALRVKQVHVHPNMSLEVSLMSLKYKLLIANCRFLAYSCWCFDDLYRTI